MLMPFTALPSTQCVQTSAMVTTRAMMLMAMMLLNKYDVALWAMLMALASIRRWTLRPDYVDAIHQLWFKHAVSSLAHST